MGLTTKQRHELCKNRTVASWLIASGVCSVGLVLPSFLVTRQAFAVIKGPVKSLGFISDPGDLDFSLDLEVDDKLVDVEISSKKLLIRANRANSDDRIEPLTLKVPRDEDDLADFSVKLAKPKYKTKLHRYFIEESRKSKDLNINDSNSRVTIGPEQIKWIRLSQLADVLKKPHHEVNVLSKSLRADRLARAELMRQIQPFFSDSERRKIEVKIKAGDAINVDRQLLPAFARKMVGGFTVYRGPNCFHASLAFHGREISNSPWFNVKEEKGYHRSMVNYDELWRTLNSVFYEINPVATPLEYGDVIVFFEVPKQAAGTEFRWIRHASVYLFDEYSFSKGSKSPDTPYTVKTLDEEWTTWRKYTSNLGVKIYRRTQNRVKNRPPKELADWLY